MRTIHAARELDPAGRKVCLAIGFFDGVHLGHQQVIRHTLTDAKQHDAVALVVTFDRHPNTVVALLDPSSSGAEDASTAVPWLVGKEQVNGTATAYVCEDRVCREPVTDPSALSALLKADVPASAE